MIEDIIRGLNQYIEKYKETHNLPYTGHVVMHKTIQPLHIPAYKELSVKLLYVNKYTMEQQLLGGIAFRDRILENTDFIPEVASLLTQNILELVGSNHFKSITGINNDRD